MATQYLLDRVRRFQKCRDNLREAREVEFRPSRAVRVINERYNGFGLVVRDEACPLDQIAVRLENGNTWFYPIEDCSPASWEACPQWLKDKMQPESKSVVKRLVAQKAIRQ